jgi:hypothetical protein
MFPCSLLATSCSWSVILKLRLFEDVFAMEIGMQGEKPAMRECLVASHSALPSSLLLQAAWFNMLSAAAL